jgi:ribosome-associated protein
VEIALRTIVARKGLDPVLLEVKKLCSFADYFLICAGASKRQVLALADYVREALAQAGVKPLGVEGMEEGLWVLLDYNSLVIHFFFQPLREFYNLEDLWADAPRTPIDPEAYSQLPAAPAREPVANQD